MKHCRTQTADLDIHCFISYKQLPELWNEFVPNNHYLQTDQLAITEDAGLPDISFLYVFITHKGIPKATASFQLLHFKPIHVNKGLVPGYAYAAWRLYMATCHPSLLVAGHLFRHDIESCYCDPDLTDYESFMYYRDAINEAMDQTKASATLVKDMPERLSGYFHNYEPHFTMLRNDILMEMDIPTHWHSMDDYKKDLKHKYKQRYNKLRQPWKDIEIRELSDEDVKQNKEELYALYQQVTDNQNVRIGLLNEDFLWLQKAYCKDNLRVWAAYEDGKMIAFFSAWVKQDVFDMFYIGMDYARNNDLNLYFNILFFSVEQAIKFGKNKLILGRTALDAKARIGCKPRYLSTYMYVRNKFIRNLVERAQKSTSENEGAWENRHPFKQH